MVLRDGSPSVLDLDLRISARTAGMVRVGDECNVRGVGRVQIAVALMALDGCVLDCL